MLGEKVRLYRGQRSLTMKALAEAAGVSTGYISQLESGATEPSLSSLRKIAKALDIPVYLLLDYEAGETLTLPREKHVIMRNKDGSVVYEFLTPLPSPKFVPKTLLIHYTINPHTQDSELPIVHHSEEVITVVKGELVVLSGVGVAGEMDRTVLREGDSSIVREDLPHLMRNESDGVVEGISCITPPIWGNLDLL